MSLFTPKYKKFDKYLWADFFELTCLQSIDRYLTTADLTDRVTLDADDDALFLDEEEDSGGVADSEEKTTDKISLFFNDLLIFFNYRKGVYGEYYPFEVKGNILQVQPILTDKHLFYIYLLMSSHLKYFTKAQKVLTSDFEILALDCLREYFGAKATLHVFGKNSSHTYTMFKGNKENKFIQLSKFFGENSLIVPNTIPVTDTGDEGIDIVGWINFSSDNSPGKVLITGQCKCQTEWYDHRFSSSYDALRGMINLTHGNMNFTMVPICFRTAFGTWFQPQKVSGVILVDRQRLISMSNTLEKFLSTDSYKIAQDFANTREEIV